MKANIVKNDKDFFNLVDMIREKQDPKTLRRATILLLKQGDFKKDQMEAEENPYKKKSFPNIILPYYRLAMEIGGQFFKDIDKFNKTIKSLETDS